MRARAPDPIPALGQLSPLAVCIGLCFSGGIAAQPLPPVAAPPRPAPPVVSPAVAPQVFLSADNILSHLDAEAVATGDVELDRDDTRLRADELRYDQRTDRAQAQGHVRVERGADWFTGSSMNMALKMSSGEIFDADYLLGRTGAGGHAERIEIADRDHASAFDASYSSCPRVEQRSPDWILTGDRIDIDTIANEGKAKNAVLRFLGVPILALPSLTFPVTSERKSGWLAPTGDFDNRSGLQFGVPYYWNIAPQYDLTLTPTMISKRGPALAAEFRYLKPTDLGQATVYTIPADQVAGQPRSSLQWAHDGSGAGLLYGARWQRVSDDTYWKDFPHQLPSLTPRLLPLNLDLLRHWAPADSAVQLDTYARLQRWQTLQDPDPTALILAPYQRSPQLGVRGDASFGGGWRTEFEAETNRFDLSDQTVADTRKGGLRAHLTGALGHVFEASWGRLAPRLSFNAASYHTDQPMSDGRRDASRVIPTFSADSQLSFERDAQLFGHLLRQTLEPRLLYVLTPYRNQSTLPLYDTAPKDFNTASIFSDNAFTGIDRISDAHQVTAGATTRFNDVADGRELLRLGAAQTFLFRDQRITPDGTPITQKFSDLLLWGSSSIARHWNFDGTLQFNSDTSQTARTILRTRYHPGPFQTLSGTFRYARGSSEQYEMAGQWPVYHREGGGARGCGGTLYAVGRVNYSVPDSRVTYAVGGLEYDAGCWVARVIVERQSTGRTENNTHLMLQLELVGLSNLGSGSLKILKDNIPGYQPLRDDSLPAPRPNANPP